MIPENPEFFKCAMLSNESTFTQLNQTNYYWSTKNTWVRHVGNQHSFWFGAIYYFENGSGVIYLDFLQLGQDGYSKDVPRTIAH